MNENWTDFEKWVFDKLEKIDSRISMLEGFRWKLVGGAIVASAVVSVLLQLRR